MDAKHANKLSILLVASLVASTLVFSASPVSAQDTDPTANPNVVFDGTTATFSSTTAKSGQKNLTVNSVAHNYYVTTDGKDLGSLTYNSSWDVTFTNVTGTVGSVFKLKAEGSTISVSQTAGSDNKHSGKVNVTFSSANIGAVAPVVGKFDQVGTWELYGPGSTAHPVGRVLVNATQNLRVALSQDTFTFTTNQIGFRITVTDLTSGAPVSGATVALSGLSTISFTTNADGIVDWTGSAPAAAKYTITATKQAGGTASGGLPEFKGEATLTITGATLKSTAVKTDVLKGFDGPVEFNFTYANAEPVFQVIAAGNPDALPARTGDYKINVTLPGGSCYLVYYGTTSTVGTRTAGASSTLCSAAQNGTATQATIVKPSPTTAARGNLQWEDSALWASGTYTMTIWVNSHGAVLSAATPSDPEYVATVQWSPGQPGPVNIEIVSGLTNQQLDVKSRVGSAGNPGLPADQPVVVKVTGGFRDQHPTGPGSPCSHTKCWDAFTTAKNVTISGDILRLVDVDGNVLSPTVSAINTLRGSATEGQFTISNLYPSKGKGMVNVAITWKNGTITKEIPIGGGSILMVDTPEVVVDKATSVTFTLQGPTGAPDAFGEVRVYRVTGASASTDITSTPKFLSGDGTQGRGLDGKYTFTLKETNLGTYVAYGIVGETFTNYSYVTFRVVPAHDLKTEVRKGADVLGGLTTEVALNITKADGGTYNVGSQNPEVWFLNGGQLKNFVANGTLPDQDTGKAGTNGWPIGTVYTKNGRADTYNFTLNMIPDTYTVYVRDFEKKHDNLDAMPTVKVHHASASFSVPAIVNNTNIQSNETIVITVTDWSGKMLNGTLVWDPLSTGLASFYGTNVSGQQTNTCTSGTAAIPLPFGCGKPAKPYVKVVNGKATIKATAVKLGQVRFEFDPSSTSTTTRPAAGYPDVLGTFGVVVPDVTVQPARIPVGQTSPVLITVKDLKGNPVNNIPVQVCGPPIGGATATTGCTGAKSTDALGIARVGVNPFATGNLTLLINGSQTPTSVNVFAGLNIITNPSEPQVGDLVVITVAQPGRTGENGVEVTVLHEGMHEMLKQTTDVSGTIRWTPMEEGSFTVKATKIGFESADKEITVAAKPPPPPPKEPKFELSGLSAEPATVTLGSAVTVTVKLANTGNADGTATLKLRVNGATFDTKAIPVAAGGSDTVAFTFTPSTASDFSVTVGVSGGSELSPVTVKANAPAPPTPAPTTTPPTSQPTPATPASPSGVPGFAGVAAIAALGAALVLFRRRD